MRALALLLAALVMSPITATAEQRKIQIETARAYVPALDRSASYLALCGGRGAGRSHFFGDLAVDVTLDPGTRFICLREYQTNLEESSKRLIEDKIKLRGLSSQYRVLDTHIETPGDGIIIFKGLKSYNADSIKSLEGYKYAWVEEAQTLSQRSLDLLRPTMGRVDGSQIWFSWNPRYKTDPVEQLMRGAGGPPPGSVVLHTTFRDNPWFPAGLRREMLFDRGRDFEKYQHIWEGGYEERSEARVFKNWVVEDLGRDVDNEPAAWLLGGDWGFSKDPTVLIRMRQVGERTFYIRNELYRIGVEIDHIPAFFDELVPGQPQWARQMRIIADSSRPETISYLQRHDYPQIEAAHKGPDSIKEGVIFLQGYDIKIHPSCKHTIDEFTHYSYKTEPKTNIVLVPNVLEDKKNHVIDSVRYAAEPIRTPEEWLTW